MARRFYSSSAAATTLASSVTNSATTVTVGSITGFPISFPYTLILDGDTASEEVVTVTAGSGVNLTVTRGVDGSTAFAHTTGAVVKHGVSARDFDEPNAHVNASVNVHGVTGSVVGTTDVQTLTNKTLPNYPGGTLGYAESVATQAVASAPAADVTGLSVTVTVGTGRRIRVSGLVTGSDSSNSSAVAQAITEDGSSVWSTTEPAVALQPHTFIYSTVLTPTAGSHTYKLQIGGGNGTMTTTSARKYILVEDIGV